MNSPAFSNMRVVSEASPTRRLVAQNITDAIIQGRFLPGERLVERELCELLGVSRTSVREALRELESDGLIENIPNKGPIVARISCKQAQSIYEVRAVMEGLAARLFAERASQAQIEQLASAIEGIGQVYADFSPERFIQAKGLFYQTLLEGADNEVVAQALKSIHVRVNQLRVFSLKQPSRASASLSELRALIEHVRRRDGAGAEAITIQHVTNAASAALEVMRALEAESTEQQAG
ncbi:GntR family transcriptional regulator [Achromobacter sp. SD115]|uniref:GntR family transcriptional regulator n=1 Tax=Achromobacter sp. SD115 TaxID=2782011 RepID=UPI001A978140|nr:GntR family transcriptional regulator [Achromobacter sp. SD115]MBO1012327.1 GntR family transcriptional regulator [Achromobacter sp. SD115]